MHAGDGTVGVSRPAAGMSCGSAVMFMRAAPIRRPVPHPAHTGKEAAMQDSPQAAPQGQINPVQGSSIVKPHRGGAILALGIIGIVLCFITGIIAWVMGASDLKEMEAGTRDRSGYSLTKAGMICGMIGVAIAVLSLIWIVFIIGISGALSAFNC
jgi:hypothetical protein